MGKDQKLDAKCDRLRSLIKPFAPEISMDDFTYANLGCITLDDAVAGRDAKLHLPILNCTPCMQSVLTHIFKITCSPQYLVCYNISFFILLIICWTDTDVVEIELSLLLLLTIDAVSVGLLLGLLVMARSNAGLGLPRGSRLTAFILYLLLLLVVMVSYFAQDLKFDQAVNYYLPVLLLLRNPLMWPQLRTFGKALTKAGPVVHLWMCLVVVVASMMLVLLNGHFTSGDYYIDSQFGVRTCTHVAVVVVITLKLILTHYQLPACHTGFETWCVRRISITRSAQSPYF